MMGNTYKLAVDAKKISRGRGKIMGDVNLFGFDQEKLSEKVHKLAVEKELVSTTFTLLEECNCKYVSEVTNSKKEEVVQKLKQIILTLAHRIHTLRQTKLSLKKSVQKFMNMAEKEGKDWKKSGFLNVISALKHHCMK